MLDKRLLTKNQTIAVALSGGKDSVCLLHLLLSCASELEITVKAINVEHGIRGERSVKDSQFVKDLCARYNLPLKTYSVNAPAFAKENGYSIEQSARILRYECFDNALIDGFCDKVATAHHAGDNAETVLFNLFRGSALSGVCGIKSQSDNGKIIRPLLLATPQQIENYIKENNLPFVNDETNDQTVYTRNFIRKEVLPLVETRFPGAQNAVNRFSSLAQKDEELLLELSKPLINGNSVKFTEYINYPLFSRACILVMNSLGITKDFESVHVQSIYALKNCQSGKSINLKCGVKAYKSKNCVVFEKQDNADTAFCYPVKIPGTVSTPRYEISFEKTTEKTFDCLCFDGEKLPYNAIIRTIRTGDSIKTFGGQTKSLKKFFNDKKIDARIYKHVPVIAVESEIYAVCTVDISNRIAVDDTTKDIIKLICKEKGV